MPAAPLAPAPEVRPKEEFSRIVARRPKGTKTDAVKAAMRRYPTKTRGEITEILRGEGWNITPQQISVIKSQMLAGLRQPKPATAKPRLTNPAHTETAPTPGTAPAPDLSFHTLQRAKELANQMGGIHEAQRALDALSQLLG